MTPTAAAAPSLLLGLLVASARPLTPCLAWVRQPSLLLLPHDHRRSPLGGSSSSCTGMLGQQQRWHWSLAAGAVGSSGGSVGDGDGIAAAAAAAAAVASKPTRRRRSSTASSDGDDALAAGGAAAEKKAAARKKKPAAAASTTKAKPKAAKPAKPVFEPHPRWREQLNGRSIVCFIYINRFRFSRPAVTELTTTMLRHQAHAGGRAGGAGGLGGLLGAGPAERDVGTARALPGRCLYDKLGKWIDGYGLQNPYPQQLARYNSPQTLISSMMSSQTTDIVNEGAMRRLHEACGITIEGLEALGEEGIVAVIKPVSFYTPKAQNMLKVGRDPSIVVERCGL